MFIKRLTAVYLLLVLLSCCGEDVGGVSIDLNLLNRSNSTVSEMPDHLDYHKLSGKEVNKRWLHHAKVWKKKLPLSSAANGADSGAAGFSQ